MRTDIAQLQRLHDAIAITMDAIRRIAAASTDGNLRPGGAGPWVPAPPMDNGVHANRARLEHSAWRPSWPSSAAPSGAPWLDWSGNNVNPARFEHSAWRPSWPSSAAPSGAPWLDWPGNNTNHARFEHSAWRPSWPTPIAPPSSEAEWIDWQRARMSQAAWPHAPEHAWPMWPVWGPTRRF